jgi:hypothetical protein
MRSHKTANSFMLFLIIFNIIFALAIGGLFYVWEDTQFVETLFSPWFIFFNQFISFMVPLGIFWLITKDRMAGEETPPVPGRRPLGWANALIIIALGLCIQPAMMFISGITSFIFPNEIAELMTDLAEYPLLLSFVMIAVIPSVFEELVFRGYIFKLYSGFRIGTAAVVNGLFFAIIHLNAQQFLYTFLLGIMFAYLVYYSRSIFSAMLAHFIINGSQFLLSYAVNVWLQPSMFMEASGELEELTTAEMWSTIGSIFVVALIFAPFVFLLIRTFIKRNRHINNSLDIQNGFETEEPQKKSPFNLAFWFTIIVYLFFVAVIELIN